MSRFVVSSVFEIVGRGRGVIGEIVDGTIRMRMVLHQENSPTPREWRVGRIESVYSGSAKGANVGLLQEKAPKLDDLRQLLPPGSALEGG